MLICCPGCGVTSPVSAAMRSGSNGTRSSEGGKIQSTRAACLQISWSRAIEFSIICRRSLKAPSSVFRTKGLMKSRTNLESLELNFADFWIFFCSSSFIDSKMRAEVVAFHIWNFRSTSGAIGISRSNSSLSIPRAVYDQHLMDSEASQGHLHGCKAWYTLVIDRFSCRGTQQNCSKISPTSNLQRNDWITAGPLVSDLR